MTSGRLRNYYRDEVNDDAIENNTVGSYKIINNKTTTSRSFEYNTKKIGKTPICNNTLNAKAVVRLKYLSNF